MSCPCNNTIANKYSSMNKRTKAPNTESTGLPTQGPVSVNRNNFTGTALPFGVRFFNTSSNFSQETCVNQMSLLPNGPIIPTSPIMPSALPPIESGGFTSVNTQYLCVRKIANICNLQGNQVIIDSGRKNSTSIVFANLPQESEANPTITQLGIDNKGKLFRMKPVEPEATKTTTRKKGDTSELFEADMYTKLLTLLSKQSGSSDTCTPPNANMGAISPGNAEDWAANLF